MTQKYGDISALVNLGEQSSEKAAIISDYGSLIPIISKIGHDGVSTYIIARDPFLLGELHKAIPTADGNISYRYRRALFSWLGGGFASFPPVMTIYCLALIGSCSLGYLTYLAAKWSNIGAFSILWIMLILANPGAWCSIEILSCDLLACALLGACLDYYLQKKVFLSALSIGLACLTKEYFMLAILSFITIELLQNKYSTIKYYLLALIPSTIWWSYLQVSIEKTYSFSSSGNLVLPFSDLFYSIKNWGSVSSFDLVSGITSLILLLGLFFIILKNKNIYTTILLAPWCLLYICLSSKVWDLGNNLSRATLPCSVLILFSILINKPKWSNCSIVYGILQELS